MGYAWAVGFDALLLNQIITFAAQAGYVCAFREPFERQVRTLRARFWLSLGLGLGVSLAWLLVGYGVVYALGGARGGALIAALTVPLYLALAAGGAVSLAALSSRVFGWSVERHPYVCVLAGQAVAVAAAAAPRVGPLLLALYGCSGIGAVALAEATARPGDEETPRLGMPGLAGMIAATLALSLALWRAGTVFRSEADPRALEQTSGAWISTSRR